MLSHLRGIWDYRHFWLSLVVMDLRARYRRSVLGIGWSLLQPLAMATVFCVVFSQIFDIREEWPGYSKPWRGYAAFLITGLTIWEFIRNSALTGCYSLSQNESYIRQSPLPYGIYPLRTALGTGIHFLISMVVMICLIMVLQQSISVLGIVWTVIPAIFLAFCFCWGIATIFAFATVYFHDVKHMVEVVSQLLFFLTPLMYTREKLGSFAWMADLNPAYTFIELIRDPLVTGIAPSLTLYAHAVVLAAASVGLGVGMIGWLQKKVIFHM